MSEKKRGGQPGNKNATRTKPWIQAIEYCLEHDEDGSKVERNMKLRKIAHVMIGQALDGDKDARNEIANRLDGKPTERIEAQVTHEHHGVQRFDEILSEFVESGQTDDPSISRPH